MRESIRSRSQEILEDYRDLTGTAYIPSMTDFLQIRNQAQKEILLGYGSKEINEEHSSVLSPVASKVETRHITQERTPAAEKRADIVRIPVPEHTESGNDMNEEEASESDFDLLRALADPWN